MVTPKGGEWKKGFAMHLRKGRKKGKPGLEGKKVVGKNSPEIDVMAGTPPNLFR